MWPNPQETAELVTFNEVILNGKLDCLCNDKCEGTVQAQPDIYHWSLMIPAKKVYWHDKAHYGIKICRYKFSYDTLRKISRTFSSAVSDNMHMMCQFDTLIFCSLFLLLWVLVLLVFDFLRKKIGNCFPSRHLHVQS